MQSGLRRPPVGKNAAGMAVRIDNVCDPAPIPSIEGTLVVQDGQSRREPMPDPKRIDIRRGNVKQAQQGSLDSSGQKEGQHESSG